MSPSAGVAGPLVKTSTGRPAGLTLRSAAGLVLPGPGLGVGAGVITGKSPAAFPAPTIFYMTNVLFHLGLGLALAIGLIVLLFVHEMGHVAALEQLGIKYPTVRAGTN